MKFDSSAFVLQQHLKIYVFVLCKTKYFKANRGKRTWSLIRISADIRSLDVNNLERTQILSNIRKQKASMRKDGFVKAKSVKRKKILIEEDTEIKGREQWGSWNKKMEHLQPKRDCKPIVSNKTYVKLKYIAQFFMV